LGSLDALQRNLQAAVEQAAISPRSHGSKRVCLPLMLRVKVNLNIVTACPLLVSSRMVVSCEFAFNLVKMYESTRAKVALP
jgi:hypothetical protein